jgi:antitoxin (DNA-binding transcriptional repressor) of toxin-antitoxin stability system
MAEQLKPIDIGDDPTLLRIVEEVRAGKQPRVLRHDGEDVAMVVPISSAPGRRRRRGTKTEADRAAFRSAAGGWKGLIDIDQFINDIHESRWITGKP